MIVTQPHDVGLFSLKNPPKVQLLYESLSHNMIIGRCFAFLTYHTSIKGRVIDGEPIA